MNRTRIQEMIERLDPTAKVKRLETELDGDTATGAIGLRAALFQTYRDLRAQERLVEARELLVVPERQAQLAKDDLQRADYQRRSLEMTVQYLADQIESVEHELAAALKIGSGETSEPGPIAETPPEAKAV